MNSKSHENVIIKTAELDMAILNRIGDLRESKLPPNRGVEACKWELAYPIAGVLSLLREEYRHEIMENALGLAHQVTSPPRGSTTAIIVGSDK